MVSRADAAEITIRWGVMIPMRDGVQLNATIFLPRDPFEPQPCILSITSDSLHDVGVNFASRGYPFAAVDARGRGESGGTFHPYLQEVEDGYDAVEWFARQTFSNGQIGMCGGSYLGYAQWATAKECPPHLCTIVPTAAPFIGVDFPMRNNIRYPYLVQWLTLTHGRASQIKSFSDRAFWSMQYKRWHESGSSFSALGVDLPDARHAILQEWLSHPQLDDYWDACNPCATDYARMQIPVLTITGSQDAPAKRGA